MLDEDGIEHSFTIEEVQANTFKKLDATKDPVKIENWISQLPSENIDYEIMIVKSAIHVALHTALLAHQAVWHSLDLWTKPVKQAIATKPIAKGKLILLPLAKQIEHSIGKKKDGQSEHTTLLGKTTVCKKTVFFYIKPTFAELKVEDGKKAAIDSSKYGFVTPYTFVQAVEDENEVNMITHSLKASPFNIPCIMNKSKIRTDDVIKIMKPPSSSASSSGDPSKKANTA
jgi:hypothetical protein